MKVRLELSQLVNKERNEWRHILYAEVDTAQARPEELQNWMQFSCRDGFCWDEPADDNLEADMPL
jgi:hypothetical protein